MLTVRNAMAENRSISGVAVYIPSDVDADGFALETTASFFASFFPLTV